MPQVNHSSSIDCINCPSCPSHLYWLSNHPRPSLALNTAPKTHLHKTPPRMSSSSCPWNLPKPSLLPGITSFLFSPLPCLVQALLNSLTTESCKNWAFKSIPHMPIHISTCCKTKLPEEAFCSPSYKTLLTAHCLQLCFTSISVISLLPSQSSCLPGLVIVL